MNNIEAARSAPECRLCLQPSSEEHSLLSENVIEMVENLTNIKVRLSLNRNIFCKMIICS